MMNDQNTSGSNYSGGFSFPQPGQGTQSNQGAGQSVPVPPTPVNPQPVQPVQQVQPAAPQAPMYSMPTGTQPAYAPPVQAAPQAPIQQVQPVQPAPAPAPAPMAPNPSAPMYGMDPSASNPYGAAPVGGGMGGTNPPLPPGFDPNYVFGSRMQDFTTTIKLAATSLSFDEAKFLNLLAGSISLSKDEKKRILDSMPRLRQEQVDELIRIFEEERTKFIELSQKHGPQLKKLEDEHMADWKDIELEQKAFSQKQDEEDQAEAIRKQLGLG